MSKIAVHPATSFESKRSNQTSLYNVAGAAALLAVLVALLDIALTFLPAGAEQPGSLSAVEWFELFQDNWFFGLRNLGLLPNILSLTLLIPVYIALFAAHRAEHQNYAMLAMVLSFIGTAIYLANNAAFPMWALSAKYAAATAETQRTLLAAAGEAVLARGEDFTPGSFAGFVFGEIAMIMISLVMLRSKIFNKASATTGILAGLFLTIFTIWSTFIPVLFELSLLVAMIGGLLSIVWYILIARRLLQLGSLQ